MNSRRRKRAWNRASSSDAFRRTCVGKFQARAKAAHKTVEIVVYPDAPHGFNADYRPSYNAEAAKDGWAMTLAWFKKYGVA